MQLWRFRRAGRVPNGALGRVVPISARFPGKKIGLSRLNPNFWQENAKFLSVVRMQARQGQIGKKRVVIKKGDGRTAAPAVLCVCVFASCVCVCFVCVCLHVVCVCLLIGYGMHNL